jgi:hypothetical protein
MQYSGFSWLVMGFSDRYYKRRIWPFISKEDEELQVRISYYQFEKEGVDA